MAKVLLVEDDNNLREIYQARLTAEGYDIVTAQNGEEALVVAKQNKPDLIISDVMMPRISGFEMLDILRNTNELKGTRVIMLTALGQADDQKRADSLGADRYLVKSQVTLEDIVNSAKEILAADGAAPAPDTPAPAPAAPEPAAQQVAPTITDAPVQVAPEPGATPAAAAPNPAPAPTPPAPDTPAPAPAAPEPPTPVEPPAQPLSAPDPAPVDPAPDPAPEPAADSPSTPAAPPAPGSVDAAAQGLEAEEAALQAQIASYSNQLPADQPEADTATTTSNDQAIADAVKQLNSPSEPTPTPPPADAAPAPEPAPGAAPDAVKAGDSSPVAGKKIIQPLSDPTAKPDLDALLAKEEAKDPSSTPTTGQPYDPNSAL